MTTTTPVKPILRYYGGKWTLGEWVIKHLPPHRIYVEPFGGAASVLLRKPRAFSEVYNDIDGDIVNLFRVLQRRSSYSELEWALRYTPFSRDEFEAAFKPTDDPIERARRVLIRSWMAHSSVGSLRKTGFRGNVVGDVRTMPATDWKRLKDHLCLVVERLQEVCIENRPAMQVINGHDHHETLFYVDPPYPHSTRSEKRGYRHEMTDDDHRALATALHNVEGMVVISGYPCDLYDLELYPDWRRVEKEHLANKGAKRVEVLWINTAASRALDLETFPLFAI